MCLSIFQRQALLPSRLASWTAREVHSWAELAGLPDEAKTYLADHATDLLRALQQQLQQQQQPQRGEEGMQTTRSFLDSVLAGLADDSLRREVVLHLQQLVAQLQRCGGSDDLLYISTAGVRRLGQKVALRASNGKLVYVRLLDFAGQSEYYLSHQAFLGSPLAIYLVVTNALQHPQQTRANLRHVPAGAVILRAAGQALLACFVRMSALSSNKILTIGSKI